MTTCDLCGHSVNKVVYITIFGNICDACDDFMRKMGGILCKGCTAPFPPDQLNANGYCPGCTKLNAAKAQYSQQRQQFYKHAQTIGGSPVMAYQRRSGGPYAAPGARVAARQQAPQCSFTWDMPRMAYGVKSDFNPNFIEFIKAKVPVSDRAPDYDPTTKKFNCWYIKEAWFDILFELASQLWPNAVSVITRAQAEKAWKEQEDARAAMIAAQRQAVLGPFESALLEFCSLCDADALRAARNKMAIALHPDKGGDSNKMARLNASWYIVETELKKLTEKK